MYSVCRQSYETPNSSCIDRFEESKDSVPSSTAKPVAKTVNKECSSSEEDDDDSSEESSDDERSKQQQAKKATQASTKSNSSDSYEEYFDEKSEDEKPPKIPKKVVLRSGRYMHEHIYALCLHGNYVTDSSEESFDKESEDENLLKTPKKVVLRSSRYMHASAYICPLIKWQLCDFVFTYRVSELPIKRFTWSNLIVRVGKMAR
ncbi:nucleolin-like isoform X3 [Zingiber officinale]|uniref:nucleolin-like isoform X3 n=1 Tax=Zingiber officinale TaxID=94328 RepID=UPI001C4AE480|nr:nucleolin-like isoform X3 [Zingiber officinale]